MLIIFLNKVHFFYFCCIIHKDVGIKRYFDPSDTELLRALHSRNSKNIRNPLILLQKMASYSCFWRVPSSQILLQASLHRIYDLLTLVSSYVFKLQRSGRRSLALAIILCLPAFPVYLPEFLMLPLQELLPHGKQLPGFCRHPLLRSFQ